MESFVTYLMLDVSDLFDRGEAIQCWLDGEYAAALEYLDPQTIADAFTPAAPTSKGGE